ncbi:MAG TPA: ABC transporter ATP-binding protein [Flavisolibacter sp.]|nr:ABC transporter ATP-binding protein [Flavisolibacter sp.]
MSDIALEIKDVSKYYRLGTVSTGSLRQDMHRWWTKNMLRKSDPFFDPGSNSKKPAHIWALNNINLEIKQGEVWGIIGANGAGKSTLLKIISRITKPTKGIVRGNGIVSSLLEAGTGFHPELSGKENIYLSGYILGMKKADIRKNFDAIVSFSGIEKFIDTPVKRYSSGMYVRLAFAIAAHLEPDILIVDEVLAVGDAEFQKKCLGKMHEVSQEKGRTILFVSHNIQAIKQLCEKAMWLQAGVEMGTGDVNTIANKYVNSVQKNNLKQSWDQENAPGNEYVRIKEVELIPQLPDPDAPVDIRIPLEFKIQFWNNLENQNLNIGLLLYSYSGECIFDVASPVGNFSKGILEGSCSIPGNFLNDGSYYLSVIIVQDTSIPLFELEECISFEVADFRENTNWYGKWMGAVRPRFPFTLHQKTGI